VPRRPWHPTLPVDADTHSQPQPRRMVPRRPWHPTLPVRTVVLLAYCTAITAQAVTMPAVEVQAASVDRNHVTYRLTVELRDDAHAETLHAVVGTAAAPIVLPPAYQSQLGAHIGGVSPLLLAKLPPVLRAQAAADSWISVGLTTGNKCVKGQVSE
jgi:hypothetical protein